MVLDAYAVIAALVGERAGAEVEPLLENGIVCAPNLAEVLRVELVRLPDWRGRRP